MFKHILMASDLSPRSERALRRAFLLAEEFDAKLTVLSIVDSDLPEMIAAQLMADTESALTSLCATVSDRGAEILVHVDNPVEGIVAAVSEFDTDLLCLGVHRPRPFWDLFSGTTMERIVRGSRCPVLLVKDPADHTYDRVLAGIDLSPACVAAVNTSCAMAPDADVTVFHAYHVPYKGMIAPMSGDAAFAPFEREAARALDDWWEKVDLPDRITKPEPEPTNRAHALSQHLTAIRPQLLAVGAHARHGLAPTMLGSFTEQILRDPPCDVLVARRAETLV